MFGSAEFFPANKSYLIFFVEAFPYEISLQIFDGGEDELWGCQGRESINWESL